MEIFSSSYPSKRPKIDDIGRFEQHREIDLGEGIRHATSVPTNVSSSAEEEQEPKGEEANETERHVRGLSAPLDVRAIWLGKLQDATNIQCLDTSNTFESQLLEEIQSIRAKVSRSTTPSSRRFQRVFDRDFSPPKTGCFLVPTQQLNLSLKSNVSDSECGRHAILRRLEPTPIAEQPNFPTSSVRTPLPTPLEVDDRIPYNALSAEPQEPIIPGSKSLNLAKTTQEFVLKQSAQKPRGRRPKNPYLNIIKLEGCLFLHSVTGGDEPHNTVVYASAPHDVVREALYLPGPKDFDYSPIGPYRTAAVWEFIARTFMKVEGKKQLKGKYRAKQKRSVNHMSGKNLPGGSKLRFEVPTWEQEALEKQKAYEEWMAIFKLGGSGRFIMETIGKRKRCIYCDAKY